MTSPDPASPLHVRTLEDLLNWAPSHEAQVQAFWREQWRKNAAMELDMQALEKTVSTLRGRWLFFSGGLSFAGAAIPTVIFLLTKGVT